MSITIDIKDRVSPAMKRLAQALPSRALNLRIAASAGNLTKRQLIGRNSQGNAQGFPRTNFFGHAAESVQYRGSDSEAVVSIHQVGFAQRYFGGTIRPVKAKALTIPVHPKAYAHRAREFDLKLITQKTGSRVLALLVRARAGMALGEVYYLLVKLVTQRADPTVLPTEAQYSRVVDDTVTRYVRKTVEGRGGQA